MSKLRQEESEELGGMKKLDTDDYSNHNPKGVM